MKLGTRFIVTILLGISAAGLVRLVRVQSLQAASDGFREFTLIRTERSQSRHPQPLEREVHEYRRADGSRVIAEYAEARKEPSRRFLYLVPERVRVQVDDVLRLRTTLHGKGEPPPRPPAKDAQCGVSRIVQGAKPFFVGEEMLLNTMTVLIRTEHSSPDGEMYRNTVWKAPELDCATLRMSEDRIDRTTGKVTGHFEMKVRSITNGPPDERLFTIPADYVEKSPSQMQLAQLARMEDTAPSTPESMRRRLDREDQQYFENHRAAGVP